MKQMAFRQFTEDKLALLRKTSFYGGQVLTYAEKVRVQTIENLLEEYKKKIEVGLLNI